MAEFSIKTDRISREADDLFSLAKKMDGLHSDLIRVTLTPSFTMAFKQLFEGSNGPYTQLISAASRLRKEIEKARFMGQGLNAVLQRYIEAENLIQNHNGVVSYNRPSGQELLSDSKEEKDAFIRDYENAHPEWKEKLDAFLRSGKGNKFTEEDIRNIKYLIYNAKEPFRSIYLNSTAGYAIDKFYNKDGAYYSNGKVNYDSDSFGNDPRGPYTTLFHECGHAIDDQSDLVQGNGYDSPVFKIYSDAMGKEVTLLDAIYYDVYKNPDNPHSMYSLAAQIQKEGIYGSNGSIDNVLAAIQNGSSKGLSNEDLALYNAVVNRHNASLNGSALVESVTDVYGGVSHNVLRDNGYGHDNKYWNQNGNRPAMELWAEYFSYNMSGSEENLDMLLKYYPEASKVMEQYALSLANR